MLLLLAVLVGVLQVVRSGICCLGVVRVCRRIACSLPRNSLGETLSPSGPCSRSPQPQRGHDGRGAGDRTSPRRSCPHSNLSEPLDGDPHTELRLRSPSLHPREPTRHPPTSLCKPSTFLCAALPTQPTNPAATALCQMPSCPSLSSCLWPSSLSFPTILFAISAISAKSTVAPFIPIAPTIHLNGKNPENPP